MSSATSSPTNGLASGLERLEEMLAGMADKSQPPLHLWDPPERPDIGLEVRADGTWLHQGAPFTRSALVRLFASVMRREEDGRYFVVTPAEKVPVAVADSPFMAVEMEVRGSNENQDLLWRTNVDDAVIAGPDHAIRFEEEQPGGGLKPYVMIRHGLEARVTRALYYDLVEHAVLASVDGVEHLGVWSGGAFFAMAPASNLPDLDGMGVNRT